MLFPASQLFGHNVVFSFEAFDTVILVKGEQPLTVLIFTKKNNKQKFHCLLPYSQRAGAPLIFQYNKYIKKSTLSA